MRKYRNKPTVYQGQRYDSKREAERFMELSLMERAGIIRDLKRQVDFELLPTQKRADGKTERKVVYRADFTYYRGKNFIVEDVKSPVTRTKDYVLKRKLLLFRYGYSIFEYE